MEKVALVCGVEVKIVAKTLRCEVGTSDPDMVLRFQQIFGGHFYLKNRC